MNKEFLIANEDAILRAQHSAYAEATREEYDPDGGFWDFENDKWETYDDMGR